MSENSKNAKFQKLSDVSGVEVDALKLLRGMSAEKLAELLEKSAKK